MDKDFSAHSRVRHLRGGRLHDRKRSGLSRKVSMGFTVLELLVTVSILGIIAAFAVPAVGSLLKGSGLTQAANILTDEMNHARQHAISKSRVVEVRFYRFADPEVPGEKAGDPGTGRFRAFQFFEIPTQQMNGADVPVPIGTFVRLPEGIVMNSSDKYSTLIGPTSAAQLRTTPGDGDPELPRGVGKNYQYIPFRFLPDGTTSLPLLMAASTVEPSAKEKHCNKGNGNANGIVNGNGSNGAGFGNNLNGNAYGLSPTKPGAGSTGPVMEALWFVTIHSIADTPKAGSSQPPAKFITWMIDPVSGTSKIFRSSN
jgi:uncharacterized protein (TIGR02596 family)